MADGNGVGRWCRKVVVNHEAESLASFGFQNCIMRLMRLLLLPFSFLSGSVICGARDSMESLLFSPCELLMRRDRLAILDRFLVTAAEESEAERCPSRN